MSLSGNKLSHLPLHLQSKILSYLSPPFVRSIEPSLESVNELTEKLPKHLLAVANTSRGLRKVTLEILAARARILNTAAAKPIWKWIPALNNTVKAVSLHSDSHLVTQMLPPEQITCRDHDRLVYISSLYTFRALSVHHIRLHVLDVTAVPFHLYSRPDTTEELQYALKNVLGTSASSLRELAIRVTPICLKALSQVTLPNLQVVCLRMFYRDREHMEEFQGSSPEKKAKSADPYMYALRALEGHADRMANKTSLRELRMMYLEKPPCILNDNTCRGLFEAVQVLKLRTFESETDNGFVKFIALFPSLRSLLWYGPAIARNLRMLFASCPMLEELHPYHNFRLTLSEWINWPGLDSYTFRDACLAYQDKLRIFRVRSFLNTEQLQVLGENCPRLEHFGMQISRENMAGLSCLLGKNCRQLKNLEIYVRAREIDDDYVNDENYEILGTDGWRELTKCIQGASVELCELSVHGAKFPYEPHYEEMVQFALDILEFLGERALQFRLKARIRTDSFAIIHDLMCRIINKCVVHSKMVRRLNVHLKGRWTAFLNNEDETFWCAKLLYGIKQLEKLPHLYKIDVGGLDDFARKILESEDV